MRIQAYYDRNSGTIVATTPAGAKIVMAATDDVVAAGNIPGALETFVPALAGCTTHEIIDIMINRDHKPVKAIHADIRGVRRQTPLTLFDTLHVSFTLTGAVDDAYATQVIAEIMMKRCPVATTFGRASYLTWDPPIVPLAE